MLETATPSLWNPGTPDLFDEGDARTPRWECARDDEDLEDDDLFDDEEDDEFEDDEEDLYDDEDDDFFDDDDDDDFDRLDDDSD